MDKKDAEALGYTVDTTCYPWVAYKGPRFNPTEWRCVLTDLESELLQAAKGLLFACQHYGICTGTMEHGSEVVARAEEAGKTVRA